MTEKEIEQRIDNNKPKQLYKQLKRIAEGEEQSSQITKETAELGMLFFNTDMENRYYWNVDFVTPNSKRYKNFEQYNFDTLWENEHYQLLVFLFGEEIAPYIKDVWNTIHLYMYQTGYYRRSFRRPNHKETKRASQINIMLQFCQIESRYSFSLKDSIQHDNKINRYNSQIPFIWARAIEQDESIYESISDILIGSAEVGTVSRNIIKALLLSNKPEAWQLVGKLLLSAQRQEGLRQVILECIDETSIGAFSYILDLVLQENLIRFSSVVRALDTWAGFGWDAEKQSTVKRFMTLAQTYFNQPELIETAIHSKDNAEVYMALWGLGAHDIDQCYPYIKQLYSKASIEKKTLLFYFIEETQIKEWQHEFGMLAIYEQNTQLQYWGTELIQVELVEDKEALFKHLFKLYQQFDKKEIKFEGKVFSWLTFVYHRYQLGNLLIRLRGSNESAQTKQLLAIFNEMPIENREELTKAILPNYYGYQYNNEEKEQPKTLTTQQRDFAFSILRDRSSYVRETSMRALKHAELTNEEIQVFESLLTRKSAEFRQYVLETIHKRPIEDIFASAERLIEAKSVEQRLAGLDLLNFLFKFDDHEIRVRELATQFAERPKIGKKEQILLDNLLVEKAIEYNAENGYGLYDVTNTTPLQPITAPTNGEYFSKINQSKHPLGLSKPIEEIEQDLLALEQLYLANADYEYEVEFWDNTKEKVLLGNRFSSIARDESKMTARERFENYPLPNVWEQWFKETKLTAYDLCITLFACPIIRSKKLFPISQEKINELVPKIKMPTFSSKYSYNNRGTQILENLALIYPYERSNIFFAGMLQHAITLIDDTELNTVKLDDTGWRKEKKSVFDTVPLESILLKTKAKYTDDAFGHIWNIDQFVYEHTKNAETNHLSPLHDYCRAFTLGYCTKDELYARIMQPDAIEVLTINTKTARNWRLIERDELEKFPFVMEMAQQAKKRILEIELKRGDTSTPVSHLANQIGCIYGIDYLVQILNALGKDTLNRGYSYYSSSSKKEILSQLLKRCFPLKEDTQEAFDQAIKEAKFTEKRLIEVGLYAQQWLPYISKHLGWEGLESGTWWLHAHTSSYNNAEIETEVARYSNISMKQFEDGAVDYDWFQQAYKQLGKKRWKLLYDAAKYISDGTGHARAKLYADVMTGTTKIREVTKRVKEKRNQNYVRVYGLVPLSKKTPEKDLLNRYNYLLQFKKESKQFGAQRQASEALAVELALENLARTAGYPDPIRLTWAMETEEAKSIIEKAEILQYDDYTIELQVNELGKSSLIAKRGENLLKSIPSKLNKEKAVIELKEFHKRLKNQYSRSRKSLEEAMVRGDEFQVSEIETLSQHPVIAPMLRNLALMSNGNIGFYNNGKLIDEMGNAHELEDNIRIAHCTDFYAKGNWAALQRYCFDEKIVQPFKQIFRELYVPTADELQENNSRRYAGHQVQPKKTVALLRGRGWTVDYEEGLQKVHHKAGLIAKMYAMADWYSPADVESPTLETVEFLDRTTYKKIDLKELNPLIFSEVMRDVDLVVSVAHVGGVDPEASQSTVEMRAAILRETARLFKLDNVEIKGHHAHIKGHYGDYSIHLGSAVTHMKPGKYLSILPVHSQHRGRIFLPFVDEDPRSAELMSKILLLAKDKEIKDPTILEQISF